MHSFLAGVWINELVGGSGVVEQIICVLQLPKTNSEWGGKRSNFEGLLLFLVGGFDPSETYEWNWINWIISPGRGWKKKTSHIWETIFIKTQFHKLSWKANMFFHKSSSGNFDWATNGPMCGKPFWSQDLNVLYQRNQLRGKESHFRMGSFHTGGWHRFSMMEKIQIHKIAKSTRIVWGEHEKKRQNNKENI